MLVHLSTLIMFKFRSWAFVFILGFVCGLGPAALAGAAPNAVDTAEVQAAALDRLEAKAELGGELPVIVQLRTEALPALELPADQGGNPQRAERNLRDRAARVARAQDRLATSIADGPARLNRFLYLPLGALHADRATIRRLRQLPDVLSITEDRPHPPLLNTSVPHIGGNLAYALGYTGVGQTVAIIDTGVQTTHPYFSGRVLSAYEACFSGSSIGSGSGVATGSGVANIVSLCPDLAACAGTYQYPANTACGAGAGFTCPAGGSCWHGTHVAGIAAGNNSTYRGVAPAASLIPIQVFVTEDGSLVAYDSDIIAGLQHVLALSQTHADLHIAAVNMSLGGDNYASTLACNVESAPTKTAIDALRAAGIATVVAAGNSYNPTAISTPGCISSAVSVGATDNSDTIAGFSNLSTPLSLFAPGVSVYAAVPTNAVGGASGTSMATPHVTGAFAVLRQKTAERLLSPSVDNLLAALRLSGTPITNGGNSYSTPRIQIDQALALIDTQATLPVELIMDSEVASTGISTVSGGFTSVTDTNAYGGTALRGTSTSQANTLRFSPTLGVGYYDVYGWWPVLSGNTNQARVTVNSDGGSDQFLVDQQQNGGNWDLLGSYHFGSIQPQPFVEISSQGGPAGVLADAVRFELTAAAAVQPLAVTPLTLPAGHVDTLYSVHIETSGGLPPYTASLSGVLPAGLRFDPSATTISGVPTATAAATPISFRIIDRVGGKLTMDYELAILDNDPRLDKVWVEDSLPVGGTANAVGNYSTYQNTAWNWVATVPAPYSGGASHREALLGGIHQHYFANATQALAVGVGDTLFAYVWLDPVNPPRTVMLQWYSGSWEHRAYWGANLIPWGLDGSASRRRVGDLPPPGQWVRLAVPASAVGLEGTALTGMAFTLYDGTAAWDYTGAAVSVPVLPVSQVQFGTGAYSSAEGGGAASVTVTRTGSTSGTISVAYASNGDTATQGVDYTDVSGTLTFADGDAHAKTITVPISDDSLYEGDETLSLTLSNPVGGLLGSPATAVVTITDNDPLPTYHLSGHVLLAGGGLSGVNLGGTVGASCTATDGSGAYSCTVPVGWSGTLTPQAAGYTFTPASRGYSNVTADQGSQDYTASVLTDRIWVEDSLPVGGTANAVGNYSTYQNTAWNWVATVPAPYSGEASHREALLGGIHQHYFANATQALAVGVGDTLFAYVWLDPVNPPRTVMLQWYSGSWEHRAYWGANLIPWGLDGSASRRRVGDLPPAGQWVRLEVPAIALGLEGIALTGMAFTLYDGTAGWDYAGAAAGIIAR